MEMFATIVTYLIVFLVAVISYCIVKNLMKRPILKGIVLLLATYELIEIILDIIVFILNKLN